MYLKLFFNELNQAYGKKNLNDNVAILFFFSY